MGRSVNMIVKDNMNIENHWPIHCSNKRIKKLMRNSIQCHYTALLKMSAQKQNHYMKNENLYGQNTHYELDVYITLLLYYGIT